MFLVDIFVVLVYSSFIQFVSLKGNGKMRKIKVVSELVSNVMWERADGSWVRGFFEIDFRGDRVRFNWRKFESANVANTFDDVLLNYNGFEPDPHMVIRFGNDVELVKDLERALKRTKKKFITVS